MRVLKILFRFSMNSKLNARAEARCLRQIHSTFNDNPCRTKTAGLTWPLPAGTTGAELKALLYKSPTRDAPVQPQSDWLSID